jgi:hypothetical protein
MHTYQDMLIKRQLIFEVLVSGFHGFYKVQMHRHIDSMRVPQECVSSTTSGLTDTETRPCLSTPILFLDPSAGHV